VCVGGGGGGGGGRGGWGWGRCGWKFVFCGVGNVIIWVFLNLVFGVYCFVS